MKRTVVTTLHKKCLILKGRKINFIGTAEPVLKMSNFKIQSTMNCEVLHMLSERIMKNI